jgi:DNA-directed RNA polymerase II subunit RPB1
MLTFILKILKSVCFNCSKLLAPRGTDQKSLDDREALCKISNLKSRFKFMSSLTANVGFCDPETGGCGYKQPKFRRASGLKLEAEYRDENFDATRDRKETLWPEQANKVLVSITDEDCKLMGLNPKYARPDWAIIKNLAVAPPPVRPSVAMGSGYRCEDDLTYSYQ